MFLLYVALLKFVRLRKLQASNALLIVKKNQKKTHLISEKGTLEIGDRQIHS